jgi:peptide/nickel transport system permease protein
MSVPEPSGIISAEEAAATEFPVETVVPTDSVSRGRLVLRRFFRRRVAIIALVVIAAMYFFSFVVPLFYKWNHTDLDFENLFTGPSFNHWFGTNQTGEDLFAQTMRGLQKSLLIGLFTAFLATGIAALAGTCAGYFGGWTDRVIMWVVDLLLVLPSFLILVILSPWFKGGSWYILPLLLAVFSWMISSRVIRGMTLSLKEREFVQAARFMGVPSRKIITRHLLPNMASFLIIDTTLAVGAAILGEAGLSYFGFGIQQPDISLGTVISRGALYFDTNKWWLFLFPGVTLITVVLAGAVIGDCLRDAFDPTSSRATRKAAMVEYADQKTRAMGWRRRLIHDQQSPRRDR